MSAQQPCPLEFDTIIALKCDVQKYAWGGRRTDGTPPFIADLVGDDPGDEPYAEYWIGAHPKLPAKVVTGADTIPLPEVIAAHPNAVLGPRLTAVGIDELPFLLKVLDCAQPLSIQAHPDRTLAEALHARDPEHYPDANHKPEIAIALSSLDAFCQFRRGADILNDLRALRPLRDFFGHLLDAPRPASREWLKSVYACIFTATRATISGVIADTARAVRAKQSHSEQDLWFLRLLDLHPDDRGVLSAYFLNIIHLNANEAVFLSARAPHAYLNGVIVECMASSDNVVRAGLTGKFVDSAVLIDMLTYEQGPPTITLGQSCGDGDRLYTVPAPEFQVEFYRGDHGAVRNCVSDDVVSLLLILSGEVEFATARGRTCGAKGSTWLWPAALSQCDLVFRAPNTTVVRARPNLASLPPTVSGGNP